MASDPELDLRGRLIRGLGSLREMLPGSFVERSRKCGKPNCRCADGKQLHHEFLLSVVWEGKPRTFHLSAALAEQVRAKVEMRKRFEESAGKIANLNLRRFLRQKEEKERRGSPAV